MKKYFLMLLPAIVAISLQAQSLNPKYQAYIERWKDVALQNQADYGIPASIIMAQALLESGAGQSELAQNANNHFGIKCTSEWQGGTYHHDDDRVQECFRQYNDASESFRDHALFLQRPRYSSCFEIVVEDYEGWAYRLRECGYATDKNYAPKLIKLIEDYHLDQLASAASEAKPSPAADESVSGEMVVAPTAIPFQEPDPSYKPALSAREEKEHFLIMHPKKKCNGVVYVEAREGDSYANVAFRLNVRERELREHNDALGRDLRIGDRIYLSPKKQYGSPDNAVVWVDPGETLWDVCQHEGVQLQSIQRLNDLDPAVRVFTTRQKIYLRKIKE